MIGALLLTAATLPQVPGDLTLPQELERSSVELGIQATATHFVARNTSQSPMVLFFGTPGLAVTTRVKISPGSEVTYTFCRGCLDDVYVEALKMAPAAEGGWTNTGSLSLADVASSADGTLWIQWAGSRSVGWRGASEGIGRAPPGETLLPGSLLRLHPELDDFDEPTAPMHVPVITPEVDKDDSKPPVVEKEPLPPV